MLEEDKIVRLHEIAGRFFEPPVLNLLGKVTVPFDVSKPNLHDSKAAFLEEVEYVEKSLSHVEEISNLMRAAYQDENALQGVARYVTKWLDAQSRKNVDKQRLEYPVDLVVQNSVSVGLTVSAILVLFEVQTGLNERKQELESQRNIFWSGVGRAPNHYARTIALRFAKLIARKTGKKPTFGTSRDGNHPSTEFGRSLEEIFEILGIGATVKHPATWAIDQLTDEDLAPEAQNALGGLFGSSGALLSSDNALARIAEAMTKPNEN